MNLFASYLLLIGIAGVLITLYLVYKLRQEQNGYHVALKQSVENNISNLEQHLQSYYANQQKEWLSTVERLHQSLNDSSMKTMQAVQQALQSLSSDQNQRQTNNLRHLQKTLQETVYHLDKQLKDTLSMTTKTLNERFHQLGEVTDRHLTQMSEKVENRLTEGFEKTNATFTDIVKRLALIDDAQKKITDLSTNVVSLQSILSDKSARGAFGEVQLSALIDNVLPKNNYALQHTLSNGTRVDCMLLLPDPTGNIAIDAKFPLESYQRYHHKDTPLQIRREAKLQFKRDVLKHVQDIHDKYVSAPETAEGAIMFLPAESIFAEIHESFPEIIEKAHALKVWVTSPTTMMAIVTTARAVLKDAATQKQVHIIQEHLGFLAKDFTRFEKRMDSLNKHIEKVHIDAAQVHTSAKKISSRFTKIEQVDLTAEDFPTQTLEKQSTIPTGQIEKLD